LVRIDDALRRLIGSGADETAMSAHAFASGGRLADAARAYVVDGLTSVEEAVRIVRPETVHADL
jgi:general secretion pathway protein E